MNEPVSRATQPLPPLDADPHQVMPVESIQCGVATHELYEPHIVLQFSGNGMGTLPLIFDKARAIELRVKLKEYIKLTWPEGSA